MNTSRVKMAMSQGERLWRLQQSSNRFLSRQQTTSSWNHTREIVQPRSSGVVFPETRTPTKQAIQNTVVRMGSEVPGGTDSSITKNVYSANGAPIGCSATVVTSGSETFDQTNALIQKAQSCAICSQPDYATQNGYSIDLKPLGGVCCPLPNLPNDAKLPNWVKCSYCLKFYFPSPAQPRCCYGTPYPASQLYPPQPIDWELRRYGEDRVPQYDETPDENNRSTCADGVPTISEITQGEGDDYQFLFNFTGDNISFTYELKDNSDNIISPTEYTYDASLAGIFTFTSICPEGITETTLYTLTITVTNSCGSAAGSVSFSVPSGLYNCPT